MPKEGELAGGRDIRGGLESTPGVLKAGLAVRNYRPSWANEFVEVQVPGVALSDFRFFRQPGNGYVR